MTKKGISPNSTHNASLLEKTLLKEPITQNAFDTLTGRFGVDREKLMELLLGIPSSPAKKLPFVPGISDRVLRNLPGRMANWADTVEKVNSSPWLTPNNLPVWAQAGGNGEGLPEPLNQTLTPETAALTAEAFRALPRRLRFYAQHLQVTLEFFYGRSSRRTFRIGLPLRTLNTLILLALVRDCAKRPCYGELSILLNAAYRVHGSSRPKIIGEDDLRKLWKNNRRILRIFQLER